MKNFFFYIFGLILSLLIAFCLCEIISRLTFGGVFRNDPVLIRNKENGLNYQSNQSTKFVSFEWDVSVKINEKGFRDRSNIYDSDKKKILIIGDSFTEGFGVELNDSFPKQLEKELNQTKNIDVYNAGINGNNLVDYIEIYKNFFSKDQQVEIIILAVFVGNDFVNTYHVRTPQELKKKKLPYRLKNFAARNSTFYNITNRFIKSNQNIKKLFIRFGFIHERKFVLNDYRLNEILLEKINFSSKLINNFQQTINNKNLIVLLIPSKEQIDEKYWDLLNQLNEDKNIKYDRELPLKLITERLAKNNIKYINLYERFNNENKNKPLYFNHDPHINKHGHQVLASELLQIIKNELK